MAYIWGDGGRRNVFPTAMVLHKSVFPYIFSQTIMRQNSLKNDKCRNYDLETRTCYNFGELV